MKQSVKENIVKWVLTSLLVTIGGTATTFFGLTLLDRIPVTLSTDERFYLNELPDTFQMIEDYLGISLNELTVYGSVLVFFDEDERISQISIPFYHSNSGRKDMYSVYYTDKQIKIALIGQNSITPTDANVRLHDLFRGILILTSLNSNSDNYLFVPHLEVQTIVMSDTLPKYSLVDDHYDLITTNLFGRFVEISLFEEQSGNTLAMYYVPVNS